MSLHARAVAARMHDIEGAVSDEAGKDTVPIDECIAMWLDLVYEGLDEVLLSEVRRALVLARDYYRAAAPHTDPENIVAMTAFVQGVTFAVAAQRLADESP